MTNIAELLDKILDACKSDVLKVFIIICGCLYILGFNLNSDLYNINYINLVINLYTALLCSYMLEKLNKELPDLKSIGDTTIPKVNPSDDDDDRLMTKEEKLNFLLNHRISIAQYDVQTVAMMYISIPELKDEDYEAIKRKLDKSKHRFFMELGWVYTAIFKDSSLTEEVRVGVYEEYDKAAEELCTLFKKTTFVADRVYGMNLIQNTMARSLSKIFGCDETIDIAKFGGATVPQTDNVK